ncbi:hypothetical protein [Pararobbsia alpina]|uniref:hypothetical protein n=1 Tax=Pararobbsia alpina TaxID=621374 RepID=UPI0015825ADB|nr:hypothetical protein [Pararobbsia alpina]
MNSLGAMKGNSVRDQGDASDDGAASAAGASYRRLTIRILAAKHGGAFSNFEIFGNVKWIRKRDFFTDL